MTFYEGVYRGNKKCRANALPGTMVRLDHPDRNDIIFRIDGRQLGAHAEDSTVAARNRSFIQVIECADPFAAGIDGTFHLYWMEHTVAFDHHIDFVGIAVTVVPQQALLGVVVVGLQKLRYHKVREAADGTDEQVCTRSAVPAPARRGRRALR